MKIEVIDPKALALSVADSQRMQQQSTPPNTPLYKTEKNSSAPSLGDSQTDDKVSIQLEVTRKTLETLQQFGHLGDYLNTLAINLRKTMEGLDTASDLVGKMKEPLDRIRKNYPPFEAGDKKRMELLMSYSSLRAEIRRLMVPPPPPPVYEKVRHLWQGLFSDKDGTISAPQIPTDAADSHVKVASSQLDTLSRQISGIRNELNNSIKAI